MKILKNKKMLSKKTLSIIMVGIIFATGTGYVSYKAYKNSQESTEFQAREREYTATRGDITAGVKGAGTLKFQVEKHNFDESVVIREVFVKEGQRVKAGDKLVSISEQYLSDKLEELNKNLSDAKLFLEQANGDKQSNILTNNKSWSEKVQGSKSQYENEKRTINDSIKDLSSKLTSIKTQLDEVRKKIEEAGGNSPAEELKEKEASLLLEESSVQGELDAAHKRLSNLEEDRKKQLQTEESEASSNSEINNISLKNLDAAIAKAQEEVNKAQEKIDKMNVLKESPTLTAKIDGIVSAINNTDGTPTNVEGSIVDIGEVTKVTAEVTISQNDIINIEEGQDVKLEISTYQDEKFTGKVKHLNLNPNTQANSTTYAATVELDATEQKLLEGMSVTAQFIIKEVKDVVILPNKAIVLKDGKQFVKLKNEDGSTTEVNIQTGFSDGKNTEITDGLNEGDTVVVGG